MLSVIRKSVLSLALGVAVALVSFIPQQAHAGAASNYLVNKLIDEVLRNTGYTGPTTVYVALSTGSSNTPATCGTEVSGGSYARVAVTSSLANWAGTQGAGTTAVSSGTNTGSGLTTSNNASITFPAPTASWGTVTAFCVFDASSGGNLLLQASLTSPQTVNGGATSPAFSVAALTWTVN